MWTPVWLAPPTVGAAAAALISERAARTALPALSLVSLVDGLLGFVLHLRGFCLLGCKVGAKSSIHLSHIPDAIEHGAEIRTGCLAFDLLLDAEGCARGVRYLRTYDDGRVIEAEQRARAVIVAGATETHVVHRYAHLVGTCRMGFRPDDSVVDRWCRAWDLPNLLICDGSVLPTQGSANPALTISALAACTADWPRRAGPRGELHARPVPLAQVRARSRGLRHCRHDSCSTPDSGERQAGRVDAARLACAYPADTRPIFPCPHVAQRRATRNQAPAPSRDEGRPLTIHAPIRCLEHSIDRMLEGGSR